jgi:hypothetical protein
MTRKTIQEDPLDAVFSGKAKKRDAKKAQEPKPEKERLTVHIPKSVVNKVKTAVYHTPGLTLSDLAEGAFRDAVNKLEKSRGEDFPEGKVTLRTGRPLKM